MKWSVSKAKIFDQCQRRWAFGAIIASHGLKDEFRREVYLLKQLNSLHAWRGSVVDSVIEKLIIPRMIFQESLPTEQETLAYATSLADRQLIFGQKSRHREKGMTQRQGGEAYYAFYDVEYNGGLNDDLVNQLKAEIQTALRNLISSSLLQGLLGRNCKLVAQRSLTIPFDEFTVTSRPDLIVFYPDEPPAIIDWKVHEGRYTDYWLQLGVYAYVLSLVSPHRDFAEIFVPGTFAPEDIKTVEYQLLRNEQKVYSLTEQDICDIEDYIYRTGSVMHSLYKNSDAHDATLYSRASYPEYCKGCGFKKLCWEDFENVDNRNQHLRNRESGRTQLQVSTLRTQGSLF